MQLANGGAAGAESGLAIQGGSAMVDVSLPGWPLALASAAFTAITGEQEPLRFIQSCCDLVQPLRLLHGVATILQPWKGPMSILCKDQDTECADVTSHSMWQWFCCQNNISPVTCNKCGTCFVAGVSEAAADDSSQFWELFSHSNGSTVRVNSLYTT